MPKLLSSKEVIKVLQHQGFVFVSQRGSHAKYRKASNTVIVPTPRKEIPIGTFRSIIRQSGLDNKVFTNPSIKK
ncbi:MAG TPA: type II toxin-antitoxin system HicA family toxin [Candidatus Saccharimonadales bacterium]|nr:type II toxin-antitoxin system HicA family toxin [Candidatus Saccharimonadales bacterium]